MVALRKYNPMNRYRKQAAQRLNKGIVTVILLIALGGAGFVAGQNFAKATMASQSVQIAQGREHLEELQNELTRAQTEAKLMAERYALLSAEMTALFPEGAPHRDLYDLVRKQIDEGIDPERLRFVIRSARPPQNCTDPDVRRFVVSTPAYKGQESVVALMDGLIQIRAWGVSARNPEGHAEAWYDPKQSVKVSITTPAGTETREGVLPLSHTVILKGKEFRFHFSEGPKSFLKATFDSCDYP